MSAHTLILLKVICYVSIIIGPWALALSEQTRSALLIVWWLVIAGVPLCFVIYLMKTGLVTELAATLMLACVIGAFTNPVAVNPHFGGHGEKSRRISCMLNLKQIGLGLRQYAEDSNGGFPSVYGTTGLELLRSNDYVTDTKIYTCPNTKTAKSQGGVLNESTVDYVYAGAGLTLNDSPDSPIVWDKPKNHNKYGNVLFANGEVVEGTGDNWLTDACKKQDNKKVNK